jgi:hypothetical protein
VLAAAVAVLIANLGVAAVQRAQARTAADAAALAGAAEGEAAARQVAADNGAELVGYAVDGTIVEVVVTRGRARARATAEATPAGPAGASPALAAALARAEQLLGRPVPVDAVGDDGASFTVDPSAVDDVRAVAADSGLCFQAGPTGPVHFEPCLPSSPG